MLGGGEGLMLGEGTTYVLVGPARSFQEFVACSSDV